MLGENAAVVRFTACPRRAITGHVSRSRRVSGRGRVRSVTGQRSNQLNYVPNFVFLPLSETRVFTGFPQVQSIRLCRLLQPHRTKFRG